MKVNFKDYIEEKIKDIINYNIKNNIDGNIKENIKDFNQDDIKKTILFMSISRSIPAKMETKFDIHDTTIPKTISGTSVMTLKIFLKTTALTATNAIKLN